MHCHKSERKRSTCIACFTNYHSRMSGLCLKAEEGKLQLCAGGDDEEELVSAEKAASSRGKLFLRGSTHLQ